MWCYENKLLSLWLYWTPFDRKATCDVAHCVGEWSAFLLFALCFINDMACRFETPMCVRHIPSVG